MFHRNGLHATPTLVGVTLSAGLLIVVLAIVLALGGCNEKSKITPPPPPSDYLPQSSIANVLANLKMAYVKENLDEYKKLFTEDYKFVFNPADTHNPDNPTPDFWGAADEFASAGNMFTDPHVEQIQLDYRLGVADRADSLVYGPGAWKVSVTNAILQVRTRTPDGQYLTYLVPGTTEVFYLREQTSKRSPDGTTSWYIFRWEDQPIPGMKVEANSWGKIKNTFHRR